MNMIMVTETAEKCSLKNLIGQCKTGLEIIFALLLVHLLNTISIHELSLTKVLPMTSLSFICQIEHWANLAFWVILLGVLIVWKVQPSAARRLTIIFSSIVTIQLILNVIVLVVNAHAKRGQPLYLLWDVAVVYSMTVILFAVWYWIVDTSTPGGAFVFPRSSSAANSPEPSATLIDYLFMSFNTSSTFGPTMEQVLSGPAKLLMILQTIISLLIIIVLAARAVGQ